MTCEPNGNLADKSVVNFLIWIGAYAHVLSVTSGSNKRLEALDNLVGGRVLVQNGRANVFFSLCGDDEKREIIMPLENIEPTWLLRIHRRHSLAGRAAMQGTPGPPTISYLYFKI